MVENQEILNMEIGEKETTSLKPARVKIEKIDVEEVGEKRNKKVVCTVRHPDNNEPIKISGVKFESRGKLDVVGLWFNEDEDRKIRKGSALAVLMNFLNARTPSELLGKEINTVEDEKGYLVFKAY